MVNEIFVFIAVLETALISVYTRLHVKNRKLSGTGRVYDIESNRMRKAIVKFFLIAIPLVAIYFTML